MLDFSPADIEVLKSQLTPLSVDDVTELHTRHLLLAQQAAKIERARAEYDQCQARVAAEQDVLLKLSRTVIDPLSYDDAETAGRAIAEREASIQAAKVRIARFKADTDVAERRLREVREPYDQALAKCRNAALEPKRRLREREIRVIETMGELLRTHDALLNARRELEKERERQQTETEQILSVNAAQRGAQ